MNGRIVKTAVSALIALGILGTVLYVGPSELIERIERLRVAKKKHSATAAKPAGDAGAELVAGMTETIRVPADVIKSLDIRTAKVAVPGKSRSLLLSGSLALDTNRLAHVHTRFSGEVVELGTVEDPSAGSDGGKPVTRVLRFGDVVEKGQLLAVLWSDDLGEKKSEYVDVLSRLRLERETLRRQEELYKDQATPERNLREARRALESAQIAVARVERTLRSWRLSEDEITAIRTEAEEMHTKRAGLNPEREKSWAKVELRAPLKGTILEVNLAVGDIVATDADLYKIADLGTLRVWAHVYEEDLPTLLSLPKPFRWAIRLKAEPGSPPIVGRAERVGDLIDPNQHTALVVGQVENPGQRLRAGQFITAEVEVRPIAGELEIPIASLVEDGEESVVFVEAADRPGTFSMRRVEVSLRSGALAFVHPRASRTVGVPTPEASRLAPGDRVAVSGAVELRAALAALQNNAKAAP